MEQTLELEAPTIDPGIMPVALRGQIPGDTVRLATADLPAHQRDTIVKLHNYYIERGLSANALATEIGISPAAVGLIFRGKYEGSIGAMVQKMRKFLDFKAARASVRELDFIETTLSRTIWDTAEAARKYKKISFMFGEAQLGKTTALKKLEASSPLDTVYLSIPAGGNISSFLLRAAAKFHISQNIATFRLRERVLDCFDDHMLLLIDEGQRCIPETDSKRKMETLEYVRDIYDEKGCAVAIAGNNLFRDAMTDVNGRLYKFLSRLDRRQCCTVQLPDRPPQADLNKFAAAYHLAPSAGEARDLEKHIIATKALGMWLTLLRQGHELAARQNQTMTWQHVINANAARKFMEQPA